MRKSPPIFLLVAFIAAASLTAYLAFGTVRDLFAAWNGTGPAGFIPVDSPNTGPGTPSPTVVAFDPNAPIQPAGYPTPHPWDGDARVTILVMGLDYRDWSEGNGLARTDSMILLTMDPEKGTAGMLSIPRDLWVNIPGYGYGKINTAFQTGEINRHTGGGAGLAIETVEQLLGIDVHFYVQVDFETFVTMVDEIGGVKLEVSEEIEVDPLGDAPPKTLQPGVQTLPGAIALAYARARNTPGGDFDRAARQQQVILAIRDRVLSFDLIPTLIARAPTVYQDLAQGVRTNLTLDQIVRLGLLAGQIPPESIARAVIGEPQVTFDWSFDGQFILLPIPDQIRLLRDEIFTPDAAANPVTANMSLTQLVLQEGARVAVLNGTTTPGLAALTTEMLSDLGVFVTLTANADGLYPETTLYDYTGKPHTLQFLVERLDINPARIFHSYDPSSTVDVELILGNDWVADGGSP
ncbi:MAG TPA: LCP family protein [Anaerolineales bacterium]|nr:LCP family protein [Anaerolineales bacterium]